MAFLFTHLIAAWLSGKVYQLLSRKKLSDYSWLFLLLGGIIPDIDFFLDWTITSEIHRTFTHSLLFVLSAAILAYYTTWLINPKIKRCSVFFGLGIFVHLLVDMYHSQGVPLLWPSLLHFSTSAVRYLNPASFHFIVNDTTYMIKAFKSAVFDMALGTAWIFYLWFRKRIKF